MAIKYFSECRGFPVQLANVTNDMAGIRPANFTGTCGRCGERHAATRIVEYSVTPSRHRCDARCQNARGRECECACGGVHHGKGGHVLIERELPLFAAAAAF